MKKEEKRYLKSKMNEYANRYFNRNKIDDKFASAYEIRKTFKSAFMFSYKLFMNRDNFWEPRYWILNDVYVKAMKADAEYLAELKKENEELKETIRKGSLCGDWNDDVHACQMYLKHEELQECIYQLNKAKEIIKKFLMWKNDWHDKTESKYELLKQAEEFLKEE